MATVNDETAQNLSKSEEKQKEEKKEVPKEDPKVTEKIDVDKKEETVVENEKKVEVKKEEEEEVEDDEEEVEEEEEIEEIIIEEEVETEDEIEVEADNKKVIEEIKEEKPQVETAPEKDNENKMSEATETTKPSATEEEVKEEKTEENQKAVESFVKLENLDENEENDKKLVIEEKKEEEVKEEVQIKIENEENSNAKKNDEIDGLKMLLQEQQQKLIQANQQLTNLANKQQQQQQQQQQTPSPIFMKYDEQLAQQQQQLASMFTKYDEQQQSQQQKPTFYEKQQQQQQQTQKQHQIPIFYEKQQQQPQPPQQQQQYVEQQQQHQYQPEKKQQQQTFNETNYHLQKQQPPTLLSSYNQEQQHHHEESTTQKQIDLQKIFTPAEDAEYISPKNRKLYASSAFYAQGLHPTVEDQVELARRISHSLSDISNQQSKGQSMYVNRKKRSVKWVHEGQGHVEEEEEIEEEEETKENIVRDKIPLKLIMNPSGQIRDIYSLKESANLTNTGLLSPEKCAQLVSALQEHKGKGAELFAKRRKKSEKWIVEATPTSTRSTNEATNIADYQQQQQQPHCQGGGVPYKAPTSPNLLPAYSEAGKHRVQLNLHQEQLLQKYVKPELRVVKTPWEAALETGSASTAFVEAPQQRSSPYLSQQQQQQRARSMTPMPTHTMQQQQQQQQQLAQQPKPYQPTKQYQPPQQQQSQNQYPEPTFDSHFKLPKANQNQQPMKYCSNYQRDLAYKPSVPQGWKSSSVNLPTANDILAQQQQETLERQQELCNEIIRQIEADLKDVVENYENDVEEVEQEKKCIEEEEQQQQHRPEFIDHLIRSPELRLSPMGYQNIHAYDKTVQELYDKQQQQQQQQKEDLQQLKDATTKRLLRQHNIELEQSLSQDKEEKKESDEREEDEYVKVAVGDLINAFEKQTIQQQQQQRQQQQQKQQTELYVPREIPLESYKPPPPMPTVLNTPTPTVTPTFPSSNTWSPMKTLPKQQFVPQKSYEPVKTLPTSPPMGGVNYTPAPLNQQKLEPWSKFPTSNSSPTNRYSGPSFNNAARGWQKGAHPMVNTKAYAPPRPTVEHRGWKVPEQLPYTDF